MAAPVFQLPDWWRDFAAGAYKWRVLSGGRGGAKTTTITRLAVRLMWEHRMRVCFIREVQKSLAASSWKLVKDLVGDHLDWDVTRQEVRCRPTGSEAMFFGLSESRGTAHSIRSVEGVNLWVVDEGQLVTEESLDTLRPTVRAHGVEAWIAYNPRFPTDAVDRLAKSGRPDLKHIEVSWRDNPFRSPEQDAEREYDRIHNPARYDHIWSGHYAPDDPGLQQIHTYGEFMQAIEAYRPEYCDGDLHAGFDVADKGGDNNAVAIRHGPCLTHVSEWSGKGGSLEQSTLRAIAVAREHGATKLFWDASTMAGGVYEAMQTAPDWMQCVPIDFGTAGLGGPDREWMPGKSNRATFTSRAAQLGWAMKMRQEQLVRHLQDGGERQSALFISPDIPDRDGLGAEFTRPTWSQTPAGKYRIDKGTPSPNRWDAARLAFAQDSENGLQVAARPTMGWHDMYGE